MLFSCSNNRQYFEGQLTSHMCSQYILLCRSGNRQIYVRTHAQFHSLDWSSEVADKMFIIICSSRTFTVFSDWEKEFANKNEYKEEAKHTKKMAVSVRYWCDTSNAYNITVVAYELRTIRATHSQRKWLLSVEIQQATHETREFDRKNWMSFKGNIHDKPIAYSIFVSLWHGLCSLYSTFTQKFDSVFVLTLFCFAFDSPELMRRSFASHMYSHDFI